MKLIRKSTALLMLTIGPAYIFYLTSIIFIGQLKEKSVRRDSLPDEKKMWAELEKKQDLSPFLDLDESKKIYVTSHRS